MLLPDAEFARGRPRPRDERVVVAPYLVLGSSGGSPPPTFHRARRALRDEVASAGLIDVDVLAIEPRPYIVSCVLVIRVTETRRCSAAKRTTGARARAAGRRPRTCSRSATVSSASLGDRTDPTWTALTSPSTRHRML